MSFRTRIYENTGTSGGLTEQLHVVLDTEGECIGVGVAEVNRKPDTYVILNQEQIEDLIDQFTAALDHFNNDMKKKPFYGDDFDLTLDDLDQPDKVWTR